MIDTQEQLPKPGGDKDPRENWSNLEWDYYYLRTNEGQGGAEGYDNRTSSVGSKIQSYRQILQQVNNFFKGRSLYTSSVCLHPAGETYSHLFFLLQYHPEKLEKG